MANSVVQTIRDAEVDARSLSEFVSKDAGFTVSRRLAPTIHTLDYYLLVLNRVKEKGDLADAAISDTLAKLDQLEPMVIQRVEDAINNTAVEGGILADTFVTATSKFTGAVARTQADKNSDTISVKDFGAVGDGVSDDTASIRNAMIYASEYGKVLHIPKGKYLITSAITIENSLSIDCAVGAKLKLDEKGYIVFKGSQRQLGVISEDFNERTYSLKTSANLAGVKEGDIIGVWDDTPFSLSNAKSNYWKGEYLVANTIGDGVIDFHSKAIDSYPSGSKVYVLNPIEVTINNLQIEGVTTDQKTSNIMFVLCKNINLVNPSIYGGARSAMSLQQCYNTSIVNGMLNKRQSGGNAAGQEYGLLIVNCQNVQVLGGVYTSYHHGIAVGGSTYECSIANRGILIDGVFADATSPTSGGIDAHGNTAQMTVRNCNVKGMSLGGGDITVLDTTVFGRHSPDSSTGSSIKSQGYYGGKVTFKNLRIISNVDSSNTSSSLVLVTTLIGNRKKDLTLDIDGVYVEGVSEISNTSIFSLEADPNFKTNLIANNITSTLVGTRSMIRVYTKDPSQTEFESDIISATNFNLRAAKTYAIHFDSCSPNVEVFRYPSVYARRTVRGDNTTKIIPENGYAVHNGYIPIGIEGVENLVKVSVVAKSDDNDLSSYVGGGVVCPIIGKSLIDRTYFELVSTAAIPRNTFFDVVFEITPYKGHMIG